MLGGLSDFLVWWGGTHPKSRQQVFGAIVLALIAATAWIWRDVPGNWYETTQTNHRPLAQARSWHYQLANVDIDRIAAVDADVVVVDYAIGGVPLLAEQVARLKVRPNGKPRLVLSYMSVGEGEEKRFYWDPQWTTDPASRPTWIKSNNCAWPGAWAVRYWEDGWKSIIYRGENSYLSRIIKAGFDGVYLDRVDMFEDFPEIKKEPVQADKEMIAFISDLAATARAIKPGFIVVPNNGLALLADRTYRRAIDGQGLEELLYSEKATGERNDAQKIRTNLGYISKLQWDYKPALTLEYLTTHDAIDRAKRELDSLGIVSGFPTRALDGGDPTEPSELHSNPGTPEFVAANCSKANSW